MVYSKQRDKQMFMQGLYWRHILKLPLPSPLLRCYVVIVIVTIVMSHECANAYSNYLIYCSGYYQLTAHINVDQ